MTKLPELKSKKHRLVKNSIYGLLSWLFPMLPTIVVTPIVVKGLGNESYGLYVVIVGFVSYFFTFGIGKAAAKYVAEYRSTGESEKIPDIISSTILVSFLLGFAGTALVAIFARIIVTNVLLVAPTLQDIAVIALYLACLNILISMVGSIFQFVLQGIQRFDRFLLLTNLTSLLLSVGSVVLILSGYGVISLMVLTVAVAAAMGFLSYGMAKILLPKIKLKLRVNREALGAVWRYAASIMAHQIFGNLLLLFERGWIVRKFGTGALTFYAVPMMLGMYIHLFTSSLVLALFPTINELLTQKDKLVKLYQTATKLILSLVVFAALSAVVCGRLFFELWLNDEFARLSYWLLVIHVFTFAVVSMNTIVWQIADSYRKAWINTLATFFWMLIAIPLMIILSNQWLSEGVAFARLIGVFVFVPLILYVEKNFLGGILWKFWITSSTKIAFSGLLAFLAEGIIISQFRASWSTFLIAIPAGFVVYCGTLFISGFMEPDEERFIKNTVRSIAANV